MQKPGARSEFWFVARACARVGPSVCAREPEKSGVACRRGERAKLRRSQPSSGFVGALSARSLAHAARARTAQTVTARPNIDAEHGGRLHGANTVAAWARTDKPRTRAARRGALECAFGAFSVDHGAQTQDHERADRGEGDEQDLGPWRQFAEPQARADDTDEHTDR